MMPVIAKIGRNLFFLLCIVFVLILGSITRAPIYGKFKFIHLNTFHFYHSLIENLESIENINRPIISDSATEYTLHALFGLDTRVKERVVEYGLHKKVKVLDLLELEKKNPNSNCIINLKGFPDTWVPRGTGHWDPIISSTAHFYQNAGYSGQKLAIPLKNSLSHNCLVLKDKEQEWKKGEYFRYRSPNLNYSPQQEDVHILQFKKGDIGTKYNVLIDAGMRSQTLEKLIDYLAINDIYHIDEIFITHPHRDHYSGLFELIKFGIPIKKVWMNLPKKEYCDKEIPWGCNYSELLEVRDLMKANGIEYQEIFHTDPNNPKVVYQDSLNTLSILFASPRENPQKGNIDINDLSLLMKLESNGTVYLFSGDLNFALSEYLKNNPRFKADIFKVPHHGTEGVASNKFFDTVNAKLGIVPAPTALWCSERSARIRNYFNEKNTKMIISGSHGDVMIRHFINAQTEVETEFEPLEICGVKNPNYFWLKLKELFW